jgi:hypothetical protein
MFPKAKKKDLKFLIFFPGEFFFPISEFGLLLSLALESCMALHLTVIIRLIKPADYKTFYNPVSSARNCI